MKVFFRLIAILLGLLQAWATRHYMNPDGISYLDMGDAYWRGDWDMAINALWSPLYAWLLGLILLILKPAPYWEATVVHLVNFGIYLGALISFEFFWRNLVDGQPNQITETSPSEYISLPEWAWWAIGYNLFIFAALNLISVREVTPDMAVAAFVFLIAGLILRINRGSVSWQMFAVLGVGLGFGYLAKAVMFPLASVFLGTGLISKGNWRRRVPLVFVALIFFLMVSTPFISLLSYAKGRLTFSDSGKLNYVWYVNGVTWYVHWQGEVAGNGTPAHATRKIHNMPAIYEFASPVGGTYPPWYDPTYWYEGVHLNFDLGRQINVLVSNISVYFDIFFRQQADLFVGALILYFIGQRGWFTPPDRVLPWVLLIPALAAFSIYALIQPELRYLGAFVVLFWAGILSNVRLPSSQETRQFATYVIVAVLFLMMAKLTLDAATLIRKNFYTLTNWQDTSLHEQWQVADSLNRIGVPRGEKVAFIGYSFGPYWARLAGVQIVADMLARDDVPDPPKDVEYFWTSSESTRTKVIETFRATGVKAIITDNIPVGASTRGWQRLGNTNFFVYLFFDQDDKYTNR